MKLKNKLEVEETLEVGVLPNAPTNNFSVVFETLGMFQRRQVGNIINKNDTDFLPSVSNSFPTSVFAFNVSTTNANPNLTVSFVNQVAGTVFAAPQSLNGTPAFRMLQDSDLSQTSLGSKANANGDNLTNIQDWQDNLNVVTTNTTQTGLSGDKTSSGIWTLGQIRKAGQSDTQILLAGGGHRPVSDFALAGSLDNYVFNVTQNSNRGRLYHKSSGTIQFPSIPVIDIRSTVSGLGTPDGTSSYLPLSNDVSLNNTMTPIFHYRKNT